MRKPWPLLFALSFAIVSRAPEKIFTPNGDGVNDKFVITYDNPADNVITLAKVYDLSGMEVGDLSNGAAPNTLEWDGRGRGGKVVRGGIYFYRFDVDGASFTGSVLVAK